MSLASSKSPAIPTTFAGGWPQRLRSAVSIRSGQGQRVSPVYLPLHDSQDIDLEMAGPESHTVAQMRILVVDDNRDGAESLSMLLRLAGADVRVAHDGPQALEVFESYQPRVVLLDIGMPGMDGYEVARRL